MKRIYLHPLPVRIWHWVNAITVILLLLTGFQFRVPGIASLSPHNFSLALHKWAGITMTALWTFWLTYGLASGTLRRHYAIRRRDLRGIAGQMKFYLMSIFRGEKNPFQPTPEEKFNPLQKLAYVFMMGIITPVMILTGLLFVKVFFIRDYLLFVNAIKVIDAIHVTGLYVFAIFLVIHVYMATLGATAFSHIKTMIVGYEEEADDPAGGGREAAAETEMTVEKESEKL
ncbi:MAG: cytochrome b/b6 domain-containing protein [Deltaproteobacteria bacterium]|nr:cytochrome b/b6 domain-containing protein [Deltaproteobacteria bacterium]